MSLVRRWHARALPSFTMTPGLWRVVTALGALGLTTWLAWNAGDAPEGIIGLALAAPPTAILAVWLYRRESRRPGGMPQLALCGLFLRDAMALANLAIGLWYYRGGVDFTTYNELAERVAHQMIAGDFSGVSLLGGISGWLFAYLLAVLYFLAGPSLVGKALLSAILGFLGSYLFLSAFRVTFPRAYAHHRFVALVLFGLPSFIYWTSLMGKESWMTFFLGLVAYGLARAFRDRVGPPLMIAAAGLVGVAIIRTPVVVVLVVAAGVGLVLLTPKTRAGRVMRPLVLVTLIAVMPLAASKLATLALADRYTGELVAKGVTHLLTKHHQGLATDFSAGGSTIGVQLTDSSIGSVIRYLPLGTFTFLFRPMLFEAHNAFALLAALESSVVLLLVGLHIWSLPRLLKLALRVPYVTFSILAFGGLTVMLCFESNFGAIVRHRAMVQPFLFVILAVTAREASRSTAPAPPAGGGQAPARAEILLG